MNEISVYLKNQSDFDIAISPVDLLIKMMFKLEIETELDILVDKYGNNSNKKIIEDSPKLMTNSTIKIKKMISGKHIKKLHEYFTDDAIDMYIQGMILESIQEYMDVKE